MASRDLSGARTLPERLSVHAERRQAAVALRWKRRGLWQGQTWSELRTGVVALAGGLRARGLVSGGRVLVDAGPSPAVFRLSLAVFWLGGVLVDAGDGVAADFVFAGDEAAIERLREGLPSASLGLVAEADDVPDAAGEWVSLEELERDGAANAPPIAAAAEDAALRLPGGRNLTQADLVRDAADLVAATGVEAGDDALTWQDLPLSPLLASVLGAWLVGGFTASFVESASTEDVDRRELSPSVVFGAARAYGNLASRVTDALPPRDKLEGRWVAWALEGSGTAGRLARWLLVRRLRGVVGLGRVQRAVLLDGPGSAEAARAGLERLFGAPLLPWPARANSRPSADLSAVVGNEERLAATALLAVQPTALGAGSRSDLA